MIFPSIVFFPSPYFYLLHRLVFVSLVPLPRDLQSQCQGQLSIKGAGTYGSILDRITVAGIPESVVNRMSRPPTIDNKQDK